MTALGRGMQSPKSCAPGHIRIGVRILITAMRYTVEHPLLRNCNSQRALRKSARLGKAITEAYPKVLSRGDHGPFYTRRLTNPARSSPRHRYAPRRYSPPHYTPHRDRKNNPQLIKFKF